MDRSTIVMEVKMTNLSPSNKNKYSWYCVKVQPRKELLAMKHLNSLKIETYLPTIKYNYKKNSSLISKEEFLFPGYIFVKFNINTQKRAVSYCTGISHIISFNNKCMIKVEFKDEIKEYSPEQISSFVLLKMKMIAQSYLNNEIKALKEKELELLINLVNKYDGKYLEELVK